MERKGNRRKDGGRKGKETKGRIEVGKERRQREG